VAPVALYPDVVLASLLPATTYPEQLHDAASWVGEREAPIDAVPEDRNWDGSVAGLLQFPDVLRWADENDAWTDEMGNAMTYEQGEVLGAIQGYRDDVQKVGNLESNAFQKVERHGDDIRILPAEPDTVYVPRYDPVAATSPQVEQPGINPWIVFGGGALVGALGAWALYSIFDDDDDSNDQRRRPRRRVRRVRNYFHYGRDRRPPADVWTPRPRSRGHRTRRPGAFDLKPIRFLNETARSIEPAEGHRGVRRPSAVRPASRPPAARKAGPKKQRKMQRQARKRDRIERRSDRQRRRAEHAADDAR
jgi:hypothetical protein